MDEKTSELPADDDFRRVGQQNMDSEEDKSRTFHSSGSSTNSYSDYSNKRSGVSKLLIIILVVVVLALIGGTVYLFRDRFAPAEPTPTPAPSLETPVVEVTPEPTPESIDRSQFKIRVLNGTGTSGLAASVSDKLKELGYQIERTGNATNSAFEQTQVRAKNSATGLIEQLITDLSGDYKAASASALRANDAADAEVIIGKE